MENPILAYWKPKFILNNFIPFEKKQNYLHFGADLKVSSNEEKNTL